jgi:hypothetical protein
MKKNWFIGLGLLLPSLLRADIIEATSVDEMKSHVEEGTLVLLGMTDTLTDSSLSLGTKPWRQYIRRQLRPLQDIDEAGNLHDQWTYHVSTKVPLKPVQNEFVEWIDQMQQNDTPVFCLTGRGRDVWYASIVQEVDQLTEYQLKKININFEKTKVPEALQKADSKYFYHGIFYSDPYTKGEFIDKILQETGYKPPKVVVVDDKWDQLQSIQQKMTEAGIPFVGILFQRAEKERKDFKPIISILQLESLLENGFSLSEEEAAEKAEKMENPSADELFQKLVQKYGNLN